MTHPAKLPEGPDYLMSRDAAYQLADMVMKWWHDRGHPTVVTWADKETTPKYPVWVVRSNLINGLPPVPIAASVLVH